MLLIQVTYTMRPGQREAFVRKIRETGILDAIRGEEAQKAHLETPHMKQMAAFKPEYVADTKLISCTIPD